MCSFAQHPAQAGPGSLQGSQHGLQRSANGIWGPGKVVPAIPPVLFTLSSALVQQECSTALLPAGLLLCSAGWSRLPSEPPAPRQHCRRAATPQEHSICWMPPGRVYFCVFLSGSSCKTGAESEGWPSSAGSGLVSPRRGWAPAVPISQM